MKDNIKLVEYQDNAVDKMVSHAIHFLDQGSKGELTLKSPTGSGKTVMATALMETISESVENVAFLWASVSTGEIHLQSGASIQEKTSSLVVKQVNSINLGTPMQHGEVFVVGWSSLVGKNKILTREGDDFNFFHLLDGTKDRGVKIVLMIDESHLAARDDAETSKVKKKINPDLTINISATPTNGQNTGHIVEFDEVIDAGFIKRDIQLQQDINYEDPKGEIHLLLEAAMKKRDHLQQLYPDDINPLVLISVPNGDETRIAVEDILRSMGKSYEAGNVALWLSGKNKINLDTIKEKDDAVEFLIFKTAVATGWDCPRAHILVKLRATSSESFSRQLLGRILRMPQRKHYHAPALNSAYVYTNEDRLRFEDNAFPKAKIKTKRTPLKKGVEMELPLYKVKDLRKGQIYSDKYRPLLRAELDKYDLNYDIKNVEIDILKEFTLGVEEVIPDFNGKKSVIAGRASVGFKVLSEIKAVLKANGINSTTSFKTVVLMLVRYINDKKGWTGVSGREQGLVILNNITKISDAIEDSLLIFFKQFEEELNSREVTMKLWSPPLEVWVEDEKRPTARWTKYAYNKFYHEMNDAEYDYAETLDDDVNIAWWMKNGDKGAEHFSIPYGNGKNFYPDFIIKYHNGDIKIAETKGGPFHVEAKKVEMEKYGVKHGFLTEYILDGVIADKSISEEVIEKIEEEVEEEKGNLIVVFSDHAADRWAGRFQGEDSRDVLNAIRSTRDYWLFREFDEEKGSWGVEVKVAGLNVTVKGAFYEETNRFVIITLYKTN